jgi:hypothetical protein
MVRLDSIHERDLSAASFARFPVWTWDDAQEGHNPVSGTGPLSTEFGTLFIRATFTTASGIQVTGYLVGVRSFYAFGLFIDGEKYLINLNLPDLAAPIIETISRKLSGGKIFPLAYEADARFQGQAPIQGIFQKI